MELIVTLAMKFWMWTILIALIIIGFIIILMIKYKKISNLSFILMIPYLLWCIYALTLNTSLYILN